MISLDDFFEELANNASSGTGIPTIRLLNTGIIKNSSDYVKGHGKKLKNLTSNEYKKDLNEKDKNILAFVRSREVINKINNLKAQLRYEH